MRNIGIALGLALTLLQSGESRAGDWPGYRGPHADGTSIERVFTSLDALGLELEWRQRIGSGYSGVSIAAGRVVTMFSDGNSDVIAAFDESRGGEVWRHALGPTNRGHDGSHDGPLATPRIAAGRVFGVSAVGQLIALDLETGEPLWSVDLVQAYKAGRPVYGFATSPLVLDGVLIVEVGGPDAAVVGLDPATGERKWSAGSDTVNYQSPVPFTLGDRPLVLAAGLSRLFVLDPSDGKVVVSYEHGGGGFRGAKSMTPVPAGDGRVFLAHAEDASSMIRFVAEGEGIVVRRLWEHPSIHNSYTVPVYHEGYLYGYSNRFLTCVDAAIGEPVWRSRQPGDGFVTLVDGQLVIVTKHGGLHVARATPSGYEEIADLALFDDLAWTAPSFANGHLYLRSLGELVRVGVGHGAAAIAVADKGAPQADDSPFACFLSEVEVATDKGAVVDKLMDSIESFPMVEPDGQVHFIYRGQGEDLAIAGDMIGHRQERPMTRVPGSDLFYYSTRLEADARVSYLFIRDYEEIPDPRNPHETVTMVVGQAMEPRLGDESAATPISWLAMPQWKPAPHLARADHAPAGRLVSHRFASKHLGADQEIEIYLPAGYDESDRRYPVAIVHGGGAARDRGRLIQTLDLLGGSRIDPVLLVFVKTFSRPGGHLPYAAMIADELIPFIDRSYRTIRSRQGRAHIGANLSGFAALYCAFSRPSDAAKVGTHSAAMLDFMRLQLEALFPAAAEQPFDIYMDWGTYDLRNPDEAWDMVDLNRQLVETLRGHGYTPTGGATHEGPGWSVWQHRVGELLAALFPAKTSGSSRAVAGARLFVQTRGRKLNSRRRYEAPPE